MAKEAMRSIKITRYFLIGSLFILLALLYNSQASANIQTPVGAPTDPQPFSFFCNPYTFPFESGKHYVATEGGFCTFAIPIAGQVFVSVYKGVVGSSEIVLSELHGGPARVVQTFPNFFFSGSPVNEQDFFGVVYDASLGSAFNDFLRVGAPLPTGAVEGTNYFILPWKWGPKIASEFDPVIIIPDILGSWQTHAGTAIDPIFHTYQNIIDTFLANGYISDINLFVLPYDWEQSNVTTAGELNNFIQDIKAACGCAHVDAITHGMGGLIAWEYVQSTAYQSDIDQLIFLGTPFSGVPAAYLAWEGGEFHLSSNPLGNGLAQAFLAQEAVNAGFTNTFGYARGKPVLSFEELLPVVDYLFNVGSYPVGYPQNLFLENLRANFTLIQRGVRVVNVLADTFFGDTTFGFFVGPSSAPPRWPEGEPTFTFFDSGDKVVPRASIENFLGVDQEFGLQDHNELVTAAQSYAFSIFNGAAASSTINNSYPVQCILFIATSPLVDLQIVDPDGNRLGKNFADGTILGEIPNSLYSGFTAQTEHGIIVNPANGVYQVQTQGQGGGTFTLNASDVCTGGTISASTSTAITPGKTLRFELERDGASIAIALISKAPLTVTADDKTAILGAPLPPLTATLSGFVSGDTATSSDMTGAPSCTTTATSTSSVGAYPIICTLGTLASDTYDFETFVPGTLTIAYRFDGFLEPIRAPGHEECDDDDDDSDSDDGNDHDRKKSKDHEECAEETTSIFKAGSTIPVKFQLKNFSGTTVRAAIAPQWLTPQKGSPLNAPPDLSAFGTSTPTGDTFRLDGNKYRYNWKTKGLQAGFWYRISVLLDDSTTHSAIIGLR